MQGVLTEEPGAVSKNMIQWAKHLHTEAIVLVEGVVQTPKDGQEEVKSATVHKIEIKIHKLFVVAEPTVVLPFQVDDASRPQEAYEHVKAILAILPTLLTDANAPLRTMDTSPALANAQGLIIVS